MMTQVAVDELQGITTLLLKLGVQGFPKSGSTLRVGDFSLHANGLVIDHYINKVLGFVFHDGDDYIFDFGRYGDTY
jgi:hypothetical protein